VGESQESFTLSKDFVDQFGKLIREHTQDSPAPNVERMIDHIRLEIVEYLEERGVRWYLTSDEIAWCEKLATNVRALKDSVERAPEIFQHWFDSHRDALAHLEGNIKWHLRHRKDSPSRPPDFARQLLGRRIAILLTNNGLPVTMTTGKLFDRVIELLLRELDLPEAWHDAMVKDGIRYLKSEARQSFDTQ
jgi:hypothetical protein